MYSNKKILAFIPARKGSKRVKDKNSLIINDKPLFQYSVDIAKESQYIDDIIVSTDSQEILNKAKLLGCVINDLRPERLSDDYARIIDAMIYEIKKIKKKYDAIVLLQPTFPLRTKEMLDGAIEKYFVEEKSLITVVKSKEPVVFLREINENGYLKKIITDSSDIRSQDFKEYYKIVGSIYINNINDIKENTVLNENIIPFEIDEYYNVDIDNYNDLEILKERMENK